MAREKAAGYRDVTDANLILIETPCEQSSVSVRLTDSLITPFGFLPVSFDPRHEFRKRYNALIARDNRYRGNRRLG